MAAAIATGSDRPWLTTITAMMAAVKPADRADRQVDLAEQQDQHDADRDHARSARRTA